MNKLTLDSFDYETPPPKDRPILGIWLKTKSARKEIMLITYCEPNIWVCLSGGPFSTFTLVPDGWLDVDIELKNKKEVE